MSEYDDCSREELIEQIERLKRENAALSSGQKASRGGARRMLADSPGGFRDKYAAQILESLPDMLTVLDHSGQLVDLVSSEETNHVGAPSDSLIGRDICTLLSPEAYHNVKENLDYVVRNKIGSTSHHDITLDNHTRHYENRIFPLDDEHALCMCRDVTDQVIVQQELEQANLRMVAAEDIALLSHWYYYEDIKEFEAPKIIPWLVGGGDGKLKRCRKELFLSHVHPADRDALLNQLRYGQAGDGYVEYRISVQGQTRYYHSRILRIIRKEDGSRIIEGYAQDMTYVVKRLHDFEAVKYALNNAVEEIYSCDLEGTLEFANQRFIERHNLSGDISNYKLYELESPQGILLESSQNLYRQWQEKVSKVRANDGSYSYTAKSKNPRTGRIEAQEVVIYVVYDHAKEHEVLWFFSRDVTTRLEHENRVRELNYVMDAILNNIPVYLFVKDPSNEFRYVYWNKAFEEYSHIPASRALGHTDFEIFPRLSDAEKFRRDDLELLRTGQRLEMVEEYTAASGETRVVTTSKALVPSEDRLPLIIGISWDITEQKNAERELIAARIKAEESDRLKSAFLANMSHEIRTPLNAIVGFSKLISSAENAEEVQQYTDIIDSNSDLLLQLINDILDLSKIEAGTLEFHFADMSLNSLCREEYEIHKGRVHDGVELVFDSRDEDVEIKCDHNRLAQVVTNLLSNAIKFTHNGEIRFGYDMMGDTIEFYVADTGIGMSAQAKERIFDRFIKLNSFASGTGLGLAISKMIVEKIGGRIWVESEEGEGTTFRFTIPYRSEKKAAADALDEPSTAQETGSLMSEPDAGASAQGGALVELASEGVGGRTGKRILIAEDIESNYMLMKAFIGKRYEVIRAHDGQEAIDLFPKVRPDLVFMDIKMPVVDGYEATRAIRKISKEVPILAITAFAFESDREKALEAGCTDYLTKPISRDLLNQKLILYLGE